MDARHLHRDYHTAYCGLDASHIPMTYEESEADCADCLEAAAAARAEAEAAAEAVEAAEAEAAVTESDK
jgi:hypothetical protein